MTGFALVLGFLLAAGLIALLPRRDVRHPAAALLRVLLPSWRFFDDLQRVPLLEARVASDGVAFGDWAPLLAPVTRGWTSIVLNPHGNLLLAEHSLLERLLTDVADAQAAADVEAMVSYALVRDLVECELRAASPALEGVRFQFRLLEWHARDFAAATQDVVLISAEHTV